MKTLVAIAVVFGAVLLAFAFGLVLLSLLLQPYYDADGDQ